MSWQMRNYSDIPLIQEYIGVTAILVHAIMKFKIGRKSAKISIAIVIFIFAGIVLKMTVLSPSHVLTLDGQKRTFTIYTPSKSFMKSHRDIPVLFVLHGNPSYSWQIQLYTGMSEVAREKNFIVVYPDASNQLWPYDNERDIENEVNYISGLIDFIKSEYPIDTNRIYMSGISGGGIFSIILTNRMRDRIAALAVVAGNIPK
jgi:poly(3-hydroxybutyrate) depolymerase